MNVIKIYDKDSAEYKKLELACKLFEALSPNGSTYRLENIYFDLGSNWMYTSPVTYSKDGETSFQSLNPRDYEKIILADDVMTAVHEIVNDPDWTLYCANYR